MNMNVHVQTIYTYAMRVSYNIYVLYIFKKVDQKSEEF